MALKVNSKTMVDPDFDFEKAIENLEREFLSGMVNVFRDEAWPDSQNEEILHRFYLSQ